MVSLRNIERLEQYWHRLGSTIPQVKKLKGAIIACYPEVPIPPCNHATDINVNEDEVEALLKRVTRYFLSRGSPFVCFRISPLTRPRTFSSFLENHGFENRGEDSVMVFKEKHGEDKMNPEVRVKKISESEIGVYNKLLLTIFEMPFEWKTGLDRLALEWIRNDAKLYLAHVEGKPVGTSMLFSLMKTGGIFNVGTLKNCRKRGVGTTLTLHAVLDSIADGNDLHTLQTAKGGNAERLYRKIGFATDHTISWLVKTLQGKN